MTENAVLDTLFLPFDEGFLNWPANALFLYADWHPSLPSCDTFGFFKPAVDRLGAHGFKNLSHISKPYDLIALHVPKQVQEAQGVIAMALTHLADDGVLVLAAGNDANGKRLQKWLDEAGFTNTNATSKNKARVVWGKKPSGAQEDVHSRATIQKWLEAATAPKVGGIYMTQPGLFSFDEIDAASRLLADNLPVLSGDVADFGCGWGYLSCHLLKTSSKTMKSLMAIDADMRAVACTEQNMEPFLSPCAATALWHDLTKPLPQDVPLLSAIVMNPPFHTGKKTDLDLGLDFIRTAWAHLKTGGTLYMVANCHLRYEDALGKLFKQVDILVQKNGFKVIKAVK